MRELEFLPAWYPQTRARRRLVALQAYMTALLAAGLGFWLLLVHRNTKASAGMLADLNVQLSQNRSELVQLDEQLAAKKQLLLRHEIAGKLGLPVEMSRMLATLDETMPRTMSLTDLSFITDEQLRSVNTPAAALAAQRGDSIDRKLRVRLQGVAPTDTDVANFLAGLTSVPFFDQVAMTFTRDRSDNGHMMREFEITFGVDLNQGNAGGGG